MNSKDKKMGKITPQQRETYLLFIQKRKTIKNQSYLHILPTVPKQKPKKNLQPVLDYRSRKITRRLYCMSTYELDTCAQWESSHFCFRIRQAKEYHLPSPLDNWEYWVRAKCLCVYFRKEEYTMRRYCMKLQHHLIILIFLTIFHQNTDCLWSIPRKSSDWTQYLIAYKTKQTM